MRRYDESDAEDEHSSGEGVGHGVEEERLGTATAGASERESRGSDGVGEGLVVAKSDGRDEAEEGGEGKEYDGEGDSAEDQKKVSFRKSFKRRAKDSPLVWSRCGVRTDESSISMTHSTVSSTMRSLLVVTSV